VSKKSLAKGTLRLFSTFPLRKISLFACAVAIAVSSLTNAYSASINEPVILPGDAVTAVAAGGQQNPQIAKGAGSYLSVWMDTRSALGLFLGFSGPYEGTGLGTMTDIYAARLDANGNVIDQTPIIISQSSYNQGIPRVAWNGQNWLVVWYTEHSDNRYSYDLLAARVSPEGVLLDTTPIVIKSGSSGSEMPATLIVDGAGNWVAVWEGFHPSNNTIRVVNAARISPAGVVQDPQGRIIYTHTSQYLTNPDLASATDSYLLTFVDLASGPNFENLVKGVRLDANLNPVSVPFRINTNSPTSPKKPRVSSNGDIYIVEWAENPGSIYQILGARVSHAGQLLDSTPITIVANTGIVETTTALCWDGINWQIAYNGDYNTATNSYGDSDIYLARVSSAGALVASNIAVKRAAGAQYQPDVAPGVSGGAQVVWYDTQVEGDVRSSKVSAAGAVSADVGVSLGAPRQSKPRIAAGAGGFLSVYRSEISGDARILAQRLNAAGNVIDQTPIVLASGSQTINNPSVAFNGSVYLVVWETGAAATTRQTYGRRVTTSGTILDAAPFLIMAGETPDVAALGDTFLVTNIYQPNSQLRYVQVVRVSSAGTILNSPVTVQFNFNHTPRVAAVGGRWLVVYQYRARHDSSFLVSSIRGAFVAADGTAIPSFTVSSNGAAYPHLAYGSDSALVVWSTSTTTSGDIMGRRIQADGTFLDPLSGFTITAAPNLQTQPAIAWDGSQYVLDWIDQRNETYPAQPRGDIYGARVSGNGVVMEEFPVATSQAPEETPFVAAANNQSVFAYAKFYDTAPYAAMRITLRTANMAAPPAGAAPAAPSNLVATRVEGNRVSLSWADNSSDEVGFKIETKTASGSYSQIATVGAGVTQANNLLASIVETSYFRVRAYNANGESAYSNEVSPPLAAITSPAYNTVYTEPASITVSATASDPEGITLVEFYANQTLIGTDATAPYTIEWNNVPRGDYALTARAVDGQGMSGASSAIPIGVFGGPATVISSPTTGASLPVGNINISAVTQTLNNRSDEYVTRVDFYADSNLIGTINGYYTTYDFVWANATPGQHTLTARATNNWGMTGTSNTVNVNVGNTVSRSRISDFDGDGKTDLAVWQASSGIWHIVNSNDGVTKLQEWGRASLGDLAAPGDYDGDGRTDIAIFRPSDGTWYIIESSTGASTIQGWGQQGDRPVPADYDGDGKTDVAVYRASEGNWYVKKSTGGSIAQGWGDPTDRLVPADYDGDGRADIAVFRPTDGNWYIRKSTGGTIQQNWGLSEDKPVPGDYDGDGKFDIAVWRPSEGNWYIIKSTGGSLIRNWGDASDRPVPGDYDGDGQTDIAVWRPAESTWYIIKSTTNTMSVQYLGLSGDLPVPSAFIP
jgi:Bacterial Ig domain/FG-GAP-like repeat